RLTAVPIGSGWSRVPAAAGVGLGVGLGEGVGGGVTVTTTVLTTGAGVVCACFCNAATVACRSAICWLCAVIVACRSCEPSATVAAIVDLPPTAFPLPAVFLPLQATSRTIDA